MRVIISYMYCIVVHVRTCSLKRWFHPVNTCNYIFDLCTCTLLWWDLPSKLNVLQLCWHLLFPTGRSYGVVYYVSLTTTMHTPPSWTRAPTLPSSPCIRPTPSRAGSYSEYYRGTTWLLLSSIYSFFYCETLLYFTVVCSQTLVCEDCNRPSHSMFSHWQVSTQYSHSHICITLASTPGCYQRRKTKGLGSRLVCGCILYICTTKMHCTVHCIILLSSYYFRTLSALGHWASIFAETPYLPGLVFPFVKLFQNNQLVTFELLATILREQLTHARTLNTCTYISIL